MYILVNTDGSLRITQEDRIIQGSSIANKLYFLIPAEEANGINSVSVEYRVAGNPESYQRDFLVRLTEDRNGYCQYTLPADSTFTYQAGQIEVRLVLTKASLSPTGASSQQVAITDSIFVYISATSDWSAVIPDSALATLDQRIIKMDAQIQALDELTVRLLEQNAELQKKCEELKGEK